MTTAGPLDLRAASQADCPEPRAAMPAAPELPRTRRSLPVVSDDGERIEPRVRGEPALRAGESLFQRLDRLIENFIPADINPLAQTGAIANVSFIVAVASGILLLLWWKASVHQAYDSVAAMAQAPLTAGLVRSLHRYSSDACTLFVLVHAAKLFFARRFGGARWLAWVTGLSLVGLLWLIGWLGYWLVWDERGELVALGTARMLDGLPIFADPLSRSFLVDDKLNSLLFFVVFFLHMLLPLAMGIALWLHIKRLSRPHFLTRGWMTAWVLVSLVAVSLLFPADYAGAAKMAVEPQRFSIDWWYLLPLAFTERLGAGALWALVLGGGVLLFSIPWSLVGKRARVAEVIESRCNGCQQCYLDCPYEAIQMVPRSDGKPYASVARLDPAKCVGCGICAGSCNSVGIGIPWFDTVDQRQRLDRLLAGAGKGEAPLVAFVCNESAGQSLRIDPVTGRSPDLPGYLAVRIPCAGWLHALTVERALRHGAAGVLVVACGHGSELYREGGKWTAERLSGKREPKLRFDKVDQERVRLLDLYRAESAKLVREAAEFKKKLVNPPSPPASRARTYVAGSVLAAGLALAMWGVTRIVHAAPAGDKPVLVVSFKHPGGARESCREPTAQDLAKLPKHMRPRQICERRRTDVRLRVSVDGRELINKAYVPRGIWHDGNSIAIERIPLAPGEHDVEVAIGDTPNVAEMNHSSRRRIRLVERHRTVVLFDKLSGFQWHE